MKFSLPVSTTRKLKALCKKCGDKVVNPLGCSKIVDEKGEPCIGKYDNLVKLGICPERKFRPIVLGEHR